MRDPLYVRACPPDPAPQVSLPKRRATGTRARSAMPEETDKRRGHTVADHRNGVDPGHVHDADADHDHDDPASAMQQAQDHVSLTSVGIDIGSSGTQLIFSRINLRRLGEDLSSRYCVVSRETLFQSPVALTPYRDQERIDEERLAEIIDQAYARPGCTPTRSIPAS